MTPPSPLAKLVLFMVCLSVTGSALAGAHYYAVDLPEPKNLSVPTNAASSKSNCDVCKHNCIVAKDIFSCLTHCQELECLEKV